MSDMQHKVFSSEISIEDGERAVIARISTNAIDREGDVLVPQGCNAKDFLANGVVYLQHDYSKLPVGKCVTLKREDNAIIAKTIFAKRPENHPENLEWVPDTVYDLYKQKILKGFSVGFQPQETRPAGTRDIERYGDGCRRVISKWYMLEYSVAPLPCNQEALALAVGKGILTADSAKKIFGDDVNTETTETIEPTEVVEETKSEPAPAEAVEVVEETKAEEPAEEKADPHGKHVVREVELAPEECKTVKRVHKVLEGLPNQLIKTRKLVVREVAKLRGRVNY